MSKVGRETRGGNAEEERSGRRKRKPDGRRDTPSEKRGKPPTRKRSAPTKKTSEAAKPTASRNRRLKRVKPVGPPGGVETPFSGSYRYLASLGPAEATRVVARLLYAEAAASGIPSLQVTVSMDTTTKDGGIDATLGGVQEISVNGLLAPGLNSYQVKAGDYSFGDASIKKLLFAKGKKLHPRVKSCLDSGGVFTVLFTTVDKPDADAEPLAERLRELLGAAHAQYSRDQIRTFRRSDIGAIIDKHPSVFLAVTGTRVADLESHEIWGMSREMQRPYSHDPEQDASTLEPLKAAVRDTSKPVHIRICGAPGVGKTRSVHVAMDEDDLRPLVIYASNPRQLRKSNIINELQYRKDTFAVILVVDDCPPYDAPIFWDKLQTLGPGAKLVTIYHEMDQKRGDTEYLEMEPLETKTIEEILRGHGVPERDLGRIAQLCEGAPRVAHVIGGNWGRRPDILADLDTANVWSRYIEAGRDPNDAETRQRRIILEYLALFKRFGWKGQNAHEARELLALVQAYDPSISPAVFDSVLQELVSAKILQGDFTLYITPRALHIYLWREWFKRHHEPDFQQLAGLSLNMQKAYLDRFRYAAESAAASEVVKKILGADGMFQELDVLETELGGPFFKALAEANPTTALEALERVMRGRTREELLGLRNGRRDVVNALESIAIEPDLFGPAARLLLELGEAENETWSNNASGVFARLFSHAPGDVAPTAAPPSDRLAVLRDALESDLPVRRQLGVRALDASLEARHFVRMVGPEIRGIRLATPGWSPTTWAEWQEAFLNTWRLGLGTVPRLPAEEARALAKMLSRRARGLLARFPVMESELLQGVRQLANYSETTKIEVLDSVLHIIHFEGKDMKPGSLEAWRELRDDLTGTTYHDRLVRYVCMQAFTDNFDDEGRDINQAEPHIQNLAEEAQADFALLQFELPLLFREACANGYRFGRAYGLLDTGNHMDELWNQLEDSPEPQLAFLGGYLSALRQERPAFLEEQLDAAASDDKRQPWVGELTRLSGVSPKAIERLFHLVATGLERPTVFANVFTGDLSAESVNDIARRLLDLGDPLAAQAALMVLDRYYVKRHEVTDSGFSPELAFDVLVESARAKGASARTQGYGYDWKELALIVIKGGPPLAHQLGEYMVTILGEDDSVLRSSYDQAMEALVEWSREHPQAAWAAISRALDRRDKPALLLSGWLRDAEKLPGGKEGAISLFPPELVLEWVRGDPKARAPFAADFVVVDLSSDSVGRQILSRYGADENVRRAFSANWFTGSFVGSEVAHYARKHRTLLDWKRNEKDPNVLRWLNEELRDSERLIDRAREQEERWGV